VTTQNLRIQTLDGWRAIAIFWVVADHAAINSRYENLLWANLGGFGVDIFFVLSGYIITLHFIEERKKSSTFDLRSFYLRRAFRILPLVIAYLSTLCVLSLFVNLVDFHKSEIIGSLFFFRNYQYAVHPGGFYTLHFWSLSIEEHFYLLWPAILLWLGNRRSLWFAVAGAVSCATWRVYYMAHADSWIGRMLPVAGKVWRTDTRFDGLMLGCATAILLSQPSVLNFIYRNFPKETPLLMAIFIVLNLLRVSKMPSFLTNILLCVAIASTVVVKEGLVYKWLNWRPLVWIGTISYSVYMWQELFLMRPDAGVFPFGKLSSFPFNLICVFVVSALSFYFIERPGIALGKHLFRAKESRKIVAVSL